MGRRREFGDMTGQRFGRWTVLGMTTRTSTDGHKRTACLCRCDCGTERVVYAQSLRSGQSRGCGGARPAPLPGKTEKTGAQSDPVGDDWMFGKMGSKGLFARRR